MKKENFELEGIQYVTYHWKGHKITFLAEDVEVYEWYLLNALEDAIPCYVEQEYRDKDEQELTDKETAQRHEKKWCILQRMWGRRIPRVICYAVQEKYAERLKKCM